MSDHIVNVAEFDFGITRLAGEFHQDWRNYADTPSGMVHVWISELGEPRTEKVSLLLEDVRRILGSALSGASLEVLWNACAPSACPSGLFGGGGRGWLLQVEDIARTWLAERPGFDCGVSGCRHAPLPGVFERWIKEAALSGGLVQEGVSGPDFSAAWHEIAETVCPELALRVAVRCLLSSNGSIPAHIYGEMDRQGAIYGYGDFLVSAVEYLVDTEPPESPSQEL
ncbi:hypothetical protein J7F03_39160 [Streptomyces sp. ISL-43]|uniref:hypothetical protein n=1 Tax=Streptomyces sp. ISL-43 TaxID=2819183 RepID=UPI001BE52BC2|nr:hypothetical protein [Streptomyces sp. ISL-43]MBT2452948.1 hypothetical protein [Streptomyces sp. ISL-43]